MKFTLPARFGHAGEVNTSAVLAVLLTLQFNFHLIQNIFLGLSMTLLDLYLLTNEENIQVKTLH